MSASGCTGIELHDFLHSRSLKGLGLDHASGREGAVQFPGRLQRVRRLQVARGVFSTTPLCDAPIENERLRCNAASPSEHPARTCFHHVGLVHKGARTPWER